MSFLDLQKKAFTAYFEGRYEEALAAALEALERCPEFFHRSSFWAACIYCRLGSPDEAMRMLEQALERGAWWSEMALRDEDIAPLREWKAFTRLKEECQKRQTDAAAWNGPGLLVLEPKILSGGGTFPLLLALHGYGGDMRTFSTHWDLPAIRNAYILAFPQSSQVCGLNQFCWDDRAVTGREVGRVRGLLAGHYGIDSRMIAVAGFSQGGTLAIELGIGKLDCAGFIAIVPGINDVKALTAPLLESKTRRRGAIITGDKDHGYAGTLELAETLKKHDFPCKLLTVAGMGHLLPEELPALLQQAAAFVCPE